MGRIFLAIGVAATIVLGAGAASAQSSTFERNVDRLGSDYRNVDLQPGTPPEACQSACLGDPSCRAWTFVRPGVQGPYARCWLKGAVPQAQGNPCCTSGVVRRFN
jgi:hypothetical protein